MISRHWLGVAKPDQASNYVEHLRRETFPKLKGIAGFVDASILRRTVDGGIEYQVVTRWRSMEAIEAFAGRDSGTAVVPERVQAMMVDYDRTVRHYEVIEQWPDEQGRAP